METELFNDLPDRGGLGEVEKEKVRDLSIAERQEQSRLEKAKEKLDKVQKIREERKAVEERVKKMEAGEDVEEEKDPQPVVTPPAVDVKQEVEKALEQKKQEEYLLSVAEQIKGLAKNRQEAIEAYEEAKRLPPTGNAKLDAEFAFERVQKLKSAKQGFVPPAVAGSFADLPGSEERSDLGMSKGQLAHIKQYGLSDEDIKKYKDGVNFKRAWIKGN